PAQTRDDYENILLRLERIGPIIEQTIALMEQGLNDGMTPPRVTLRDLPGQVTGQIFDDPTKSPLLEHFLKVPSSLSRSDQMNLRERTISAYKNVIAPAFTKFHQFLVSRYLPACRETTDAVSLPSGQAMYEYNVKWHTTTNKSAQEIHEIGRAEVKRIRAE